MASTKGNLLRIAVIVFVLLATMACAATDLFGEVPTPAVEPSASLSISKFVDSVVVPSLTQVATATEKTATLLLVGSRYSVSTGALNVRSCAGTDCEIISVLAFGAEFDVISCAQTETWCEIKTQSTSGWINTKFTTRK